MTFDLILMNLKRLLIEGIFLTIPDSIIMVSFALLFCGFKEKLIVKKIMIFATYVTFSDIIVRFFLEKYGIHSLILTLISIVLIKKIFNVNFIASSISTIVSLFFILIVQCLYFSLIAKIAKVDFTYLINMSSAASNIIDKLYLSYFYFLIASLVLIFVYKKNTVIIDLSKKKLMDNKYIALTKYSLFILVPLFIFIIINFSIHYYSMYNNTTISPFAMLFLNSTFLIISNIIVIHLVKKNIEYEKFKHKFSLQQQHFNDVNELLMRLRMQKHGFNNHMHIVKGLLTLNKYQQAEEYISKNFVNAEKTTHDFDIENMYIASIINTKSQIAKNKDINFNVIIEDNLSTLATEMFEVSEAIGNIIDNALEASLNIENYKRNVEIKIYSDNKYYIFQIKNSGNTIPSNVINKIFEQGFTTKDNKNNEHGLGLYISKKIIENNRGQIKAESQDGITIFKIYIPKVMKNAVKVS